MSDSASNPNDDWGQAIFELRNQVGTLQNQVAQMAVAIFPQDHSQTLRVIQFNWQLPPNSSLNEILKQEFVIGQWPRGTFVTAIMTIQRRDMTRSVSLQSGQVIDSAHVPYVIGTTLLMYADAQSNSLKGQIIPDPAVPLPSFILSAMPCDELTISAFIIYRPDIGLA